MSAVPKHVPTPEEYLELERKADFKSEYIAGEIFAMAGASVNHNRICANLTGEIRQLLKGKPCDVLGSDMKLWIDEAESFFYPDLSGLCSDFEFYDDRENAYTNPEFIVEVLSKSTEAYDRGKKFGYYQSIPSLKEFVMVSQYEKLVEIYRRDDDHWVYQSYKKDDNIIQMNSINNEIKMAEIYRNVTFKKENKDN